MRVIVAGSRTFNDYSLLKKKLDYYLKNVKKVIIVEGECEGADLLGKRYAKEKGYEWEEFPADWRDMSEPCVKKAGRWGYYNALAGHNRNERMAASCKKGDACVVFRVNGSTGSSDMLERAEKHKLHVRKIDIKK